MTDLVDKTQLALTDTARKQADAVVEQAGFKDRQDAYRLAVAIALAERLEPAPADLPRTNYIGVGGLDPGGALHAATLHLRDDHGGRPYALIERLAEAGITRIFDHVDAGKPLRDLLSAYLPAEPAQDHSPAA